MRVVFLNPAGVIGGAERVLLAAVRAVREHRPTVVLLADGPLRAAAEAAGATVTVMPLPTALAGVGDTQFRDGGRLAKGLGLARTAATSALPAVTFLRRFRQLLRNLRPDLVHSNGLKTHLLARAVVPAGVPVTWHVHDFLGERPLAARLLRLTKRGVTGAVAISEAVKRDAEKVLPGLPVWTVRNGVDTGHFAPRSGLLAPRADSEPVRVGLIATYANWKGHAVFLDALARLPAELPVRGFIIGGPIYTTAGSQWARGELETLAARLGLAGRVEFIPFQPDPVDVYRSLDVVVHASTRPEPFGLTIAEAMSCGRAVVVSAAGGAAELFTEGVDAVGHPPGDAAALAAAIHRLAADAVLRTRLGTAARETALLRFGEDRFARELNEVFRRVTRPTMT